MVDVNSSKPTVLFVGEPNVETFGQLHHWLRQRAHVQVATDMSEVEGYSSDLRPLLVILAHDYPGSFSADADLRIQRQFPLCRVIHLLGDWCHGEMRGDRLTSGATIVPWQQWAARFEADWQRWVRGACPSWGMPPTLTYEERLIGPVGRDREFGFVVGVVTTCRATQQALEDAVLAIGLQAQSLLNFEPRALAGLSLVLWDEARVAGSGSLPLRVVVEEVHPIPVIAVVSFPRVPDLEAAQQAGAVDVLAKPFLLRDLSWLIHQHIPGALPTTSADAPAA